MLFWFTFTICFMLETFHAKCMETTRYIVCDFHGITLCYETDPRFTLKLEIVYIVLVYVLRSDLSEPETSSSPTRRLSPQNTRESAWLGLPSTNGSPGLPLAHIYIY
jgi:hypothetical protein